MKKLLLILAMGLTPTATLASERMAATNYYVTETKTWPTAEGAGYWMVEFTGISQVTKGPLDTAAIECNGAGFWGAEGVSGTGICVQGTGDDTFVMRWETEAGAKANSWKILSGTGKYEGLTGQGTATTRKLPGNRRISQLEGEVELPN